MSYGYKYRNYEFLEWLRSECVMSGANDFTEVAIPTPVGRATNQACAIFCVEFEFSSPDTLAEDDWLMAQLSLNTKNAEIYLNNSDLVAKCKIQKKLVTSGGTTQSLIVRIDFPRPILMAKSNLYYALETNGEAAAITGRCRIGYVLRFVSPTLMNRALVD